MIDFTNNINKMYAENNIMGSLPERYYENKIALLARDPYWIFTYWEIKEETKGEYIQKLGFDARLTVRVFKGYNPSTVFEIFRDISVDTMGSYNIDVHSPDTPFFTQIGYLKDGIFHPIATSNFVVTPRDNYSNTLDEEWMAQEELYRGLKKLTFDVHGSPFLKDKKIVVISNKMEKVSSGLMHEGWESEYVIAEEEESPESPETVASIQGEEELTGLSKKIVKKDTSWQPDEILYPRKLKEISAAPDKIIEEKIEDDKFHLHEPVNQEIIRAIEGNPGKKQTPAKTKKTAAAKKAAPAKTVKKSEPVKTKTAKAKTPKLVPAKAGNAVKTVKPAKPAKTKTTKGKKK